MPVRIFMLFNCQTTASPVYQLFPTQTVKGHYHFIAIGNALKEVIIDWFQNGMKESPEEMASIFMELFYPDSKRKSTIACQSMG